MAGDDATKWDLALRAYRETAPLPEEHIPLVRALDVSGVLLGGVNWIRWLFAENRQFDNLSAVTVRLGEIAARLECLAANSGRGPALATRLNSHGKRRVKWC
jgi:hypothetical protein